jgi:hypothetical protein
MKKDYLIHWYGNKVVKEEEFFDDSTNRRSTEKRTREGKQYFERLWNSEEQEAVKFVEKIKKKYKTEKVWYSEI